MLTLEERCVSSAQAFETAVVSSRSEIDALVERVAPLLRCEGSSLDPRFFLATVDERVWSPRVVVVGRPGAVAGVVYLKERKIAGAPTGMVYGDDTLNSMVLADPGDRDAVLQAALAAVMKRRRVWALRILVPPAGSSLSSIREAGRRQNFEVDCVEAENHCDVGIPSNYSSFLESLGSKTRRNFRYYRRRAEESGFQYVPEMDRGEFARAAHDLLEKSVVGADRNGIKRALQIFSVVNRPIFSGLQHPDGSWLSILGGWLEADHSMVFLQMNNDREYPLHSFSIVMRSYLIEDGIKRRLKALRFWAGLGGPLYRYRVPVPSVRMHLDKRGLGWRGFRSMLLYSLPLFSKRMSWAADWIAPVRSRGEILP